MTIRRLNPAEITPQNETLQPGEVVLVVDERDLALIAAGFALGASAANRHKSTLGRSYQDDPAYAAAGLLETMYRHAGSTLAGVCDTQTGYSATEAVKRLALDEVRAQESHSDLQ